MEQQMAQIDAYCNNLYNSTVLEERRAAEEALAPLSTTEGVDKCRFILEYSSSPFSQHMASASLKKVVQNHWQALGPERKHDLRAYLLNFMANKVPSLLPFVVNELICVVSCVIKLGWLDSDENQEIINQLMQFTNSSIEHCLLGLDLLHSVVEEMNVVQPNRSLTNHRKVSISFRNGCLLPIFHLSTTTIANILGNAVQATPDQLQQLCDKALRLSLGCLSYDFIGSNVDDYSDEVGTIQIPPTWKATIEGGETVQCFFDVFSTVDLPCTVKALQCLVQLASVRQSLFQGEPDRQAYLSKFITNTCVIMRKQTGMNDPEKFHEFCRLLFRLKANFQISMLVKADNYQEWISSAANLTIRSFNLWQWSNNSIFYLLSLWSRLVASTPYLKGDFLTHLDSFIPQITEAYINVRLNSVQSVLQNPDQFEDPLLNEDLVVQELENLAPLCRFNYLQGGKLLTERLEDTKTKLAETTQLYAAAPSSDLDFRVQLYEGQLTWLIFIVSLVIGTQSSGSSSEAHELMDGQLAGSVLQFVISDAHATQRQAMTRPLVDLAILSFLQNFRKKHIGDHAMSSSRVYTKLRELVGLSDHLMVMTVIVDRVIANCKIWASNEEVIRRTLELLSELACGYSSGKMLLKIQSVHFVLQNHGANTFPFLLEPCNTRHRTTFYQVLARLLFLEETMIPQFDQFVAPITATFQALGSIPAVMWPTDAKRSLIGLFRDVRGVVNACVTRRSYMLVFDWLYPAHFPVFASAAETCYNDPAVMVALLKCLCEITHNKAQRMTFDASSPSGILLFRETSKILAFFTNGVLATPVVTDIYAERYKCISVCFDITTRVMAGNYVNFGVFELYGDEALSNALNAVIQQFLSISLDDLMSYPKLSLACFQMLEVLFRNHTRSMFDLDTRLVSQVIAALQHGIRSSKVQISTHAAGALDQICQYCFKLVGKDSPASRQISSHLAANPHLFSSFIALIFGMVMFNEVPNQWSLSRPLLGLVLLDEQYFAQWKEQMIASQPQPHQPMLQTAFEELMQDVNRNLEARNRDKFTQNLTIFRHSIKQFM